MRASSISRVGFFQMLGIVGVLGIFEVLPGLAQAFTSLRDVVAADVFERAGRLLELLGLAGLEQAVRFHVVDQVAEVAGHVFEPFADVVLPRCSPRKTCSERCSSLSVGPSVRPRPTMKKRKRHNHGEGMCGWFISGPPGPWNECHGGVLGYRFDSWIVAKIRA